MTIPVVISFLFSQAAAAATAPENSGLRRLSDPDVLRDLVPLFVFFGVALTFFALSYFFFTKKASVKNTTEEENDLGIFGSATSLFAKLIPEGEQEKKDFDLMLRQAGFYKASDRDSIYATRALLLILPILLGALACALFPNGVDFPIRLLIVNQEIVMSNGLWFILIGGIVGVVLMIFPRLYIYLRQRRRLANIRRGLPDTIDMLGMCASGGMNTSDSLEHVSYQLREYPDLAQELQILRRQADVGSLEAALKDLTFRVNMPEMRQLSQVLLRGNRSGTKVAGALNEQADHLRVMRKQSALETANKLPTKLVFPIMFCFAPAALILLLGPSFLEFHDFLKEGTKGFSKPPTIEMDYGFNQSSAEESAPAVTLE